MISNTESSTLTDTNRSRMSKRIMRFFHVKFERFLTTRLPGKSSHYLNRLNLFILPSKFGIAYLATLVCLFILGTNYQNNVILLLSYVLLSVMLTALLTCFNNLSGLKVSLMSDVEGHQNEIIEVPIQIESNSSRFQLGLFFAADKTQRQQHQHQHQQQSIIQTQISELPQGAELIHVPIKLTKRGQFPLCRLTLSTQYALGLFTCWTHLDFAKKVTVFPIAKKVSMRHLTSSAATDDAGSNIVKGHDDFYQLRNYQQGESLSQVSWKQFARGQGMLSKEYQSTSSDTPSIVLADMPSDSLEVKLQYCCYLLLQARKNQQAINLDLNGHIIRADHPSNELTSSARLVKNTGDVNISDHYQRCLHALALYKV